MDALERRQDLSGLTRTRLTAARCSTVQAGKIEVDRHHVQMVLTVSET
jgi:hypothetical protein